MKKSLLITMLTVWFGINYSSAQHYQFKQYSLEDGLPQSEVYAMAEDQFGYLWIGTNGGGLSRFNGKSFEVYTRKEGLLDNIVSGLHHDNHYNLWIGTPKGIQKFDGLEFTSIVESDSTVFADNITFCETNSGDLYCLSRLVTGKQNLYKIENDSLINYTERFEAELGGENMLFRIIPDRESGLLISTLNNLFRYQNDELTIVNTDHLGVDKNSVKYPLMVDRSNSMWCMLFGRDGSKQLIVHKPDKKVKKVKVPKEIEGVTIFHGYEDRNGALWFLLENGGILNYSKKGWRIFNKSNGLPIDMVFKILEDAEGNIWIGTMGAGLVRYSGDLFVSLDRSSGLSDDVIRTIYQDSKGRYYFADGDGGFSSLKNGIVTDYKHLNLPEFGAIGGFHELSSGNMLICSRNGLFEFNGKTAKSVNLNFGWKNNIPINNITVSKDTLFFSTFGFGLIKSHKGEATFYNTYNSEIIDNTVSHLFLDSQNRIWISSVRGISLYENGKFTSFSEGNTLSSSYVLQAAEDRYGNIWFASFTKGLVRYDNTNWTIFDSSNGLSSDNIYSIIADEKGNIWAGAQNGVDKISFSSTGEVKDVEYFDRHDGFIGIENNSAANLKDNDGNLWFGTIKGVMRYNPSEKRTNYLPPAVYIRNIELSYKKPIWNSEEFVSRYDSIMPWFGIPNQLLLSKSQNNISFEFDALCYSVPEKIEYKWRLEPIEAEWIVGKNNEVAYPSLPPGDYTFRVTAANNSGIWNDEGAFYQFSIHPAWYQTLAFKVLIFAFIVALVIISILSYNRRLQTLRFEMETLVISKTKEIRQQKKEIEAKNEALLKQKEKITHQADSIASSYTDLEKLTEIGKTLTANLSTNKIFELVYNATSAIMDTYLFGFGLFNQDSNSIDFQNINLKGERMPFITFPLDDVERLSVHCLVNDKEIFIGDFDKEYKNYIQEIRPVPGDINSKSIIYIPIKVSSAPFGVITVQSEDTNAYTAYHLNFMRNIGIYTSIALENANAFQQLKEQQESLESANKIAIRQKEEMQIQKDDVDRLYEENNHLITLFTTELERPITSSLSIANALRNEGKVSMEEMDKALHKILESLWQIKDMLNQVSEIKRLEKEDYSINKSKVPLTPLLKEVAAQYEEYLKNKSIEVIWQLDDSIIESDYSLLEKVFSNLLSNAIKFSEPETNITISCLEKDDQITVGIRDEGPGMSEEDQKRLFTKFNKLSTQPTGDEVSSGLGLYIVKRYLDGLGADITYTSHIGIGTTFYVNIPK